ncbi:metallophosphoesterase [Paraburkholderia phytofirmans]|uniref:metallophosphoesterase n=1 Tax=Paraburkholderia phytofirmans TaxID=261302 RepID=UPI0038B88371
MKKQFSWLHLSDLHIGQTHQRWWPNFKNIFHKDLRRLVNEVKPLDVVIFSGDLTQRGDNDEYAALTRELSELWEIFSEADHHPVLFTVPGNHDLVRPPENDARVKLLKQWGTDPDIQREFWSETNNQYMQVVRTAFGNYEQWVEAVAAAGIPLAKGKKGLLPGDIAASLNCNDVTVGLIGLNSAFLQLTGDDYEGKLSLDFRQLSEVTDNDPPGWCEKHELNFLVTHHPTNWLNSDAYQEFNAEIYPTARFTCHLFGHMHDADLVTTSHGGDAGRKSFQSSSLFGMEFLADGVTERVHGYSLGQVGFDDSTTTLRLWPRKGIVNRKSGDRRIVPDHDNFALEPGEEYLVETLERSASASSAAALAYKAPPPDLASFVEDSDPRWTEILAGSAYTLIEQEQHVAIRKLEQQAFAENIRQKKISWICADWGLGRDGFAWSAIKKIGRESQPVFRIDLRNYQVRDEFLADFTRLMGCAFSEYCTALAQIGPAVLLFDEAPVAIGQSTGALIERDAEGLAEMVRDFCPDVLIILLARRAPKGQRIGIVTLDPLDEVETKTYLFAHPRADAETRTARAATEIFRRTDGLPGKIDRVLGTLRVVSLSELGPPTGKALADLSQTYESVPQSLAMAVDELAESVDPNVRRSFLLLKVLAVLPHGESLRRLKRVDNQQPLFERHAEELLDRDLIQTRASATLISATSGDQERLKILFAPRQVRDYVLSRMQPREIEALVRKAASLYFGEQWRVGNASLRKLDGPLTSDDGSLLENPHYLVMWLLSNGATWQRMEAANAVLGLSKIYCSALHEAKLYRHCATVCRDVLGLIPEDSFVSDRDTIEMLFSKSLRMNGEHSEALAIFERLLTVSRTKDIRSSLQLNLALCLQSMGDTRAIAAAQDVMELQPKSANAIQAESIVLEMTEHASKSTELLRLENEARKRGFNTVANNLTLDRVEGGEEDSSISEVLRQVYRSSIASGDNYNAARAAVKLGTRLLRSGDPLADGDLRLLIDSYQYFYGQRFGGLFSSAHKALWEYFEQKKDARNLLSLFRHSSFIWRLHENEKRELIYADRLSKNFRKILSADILTADKNTAYFLLRAQNSKLASP